MVHEAVIVAEIAGLKTISVWQRLGGPRYRLAGMVCMNKFFILPHKSVGQRATWHISSEASPAF